MATRINARIAQDILIKNLQDDGTIVKDFGTMVAFAAALSNPPSTVTAAVALILSTAGSTISAASRIYQRLTTRDTTSTRSILPPYYTFHVQFYVLHQRAFLEAIQAHKKALESLTNARKKGDTPRGDNDNALREQFAHAQENFLEADVAYDLYLGPASPGSGTLFSAFRQSLNLILMASGADEEQCKAITSTIQKDAEKRILTALASNEPGCEWMRRYLALASQEQISAIHSDLRTLGESLNGWKEIDRSARDTSKEAWERYREMLRQLPDSKETMFNEEFGVRKVFVAPIGTYHRAGYLIPGEKPGMVSDLGMLFGALSSTRVSGEDLVILCGGPGSGKSTFCRILSSQLAEDSDVHPVFLRLRRIKEGSDISSFIEESMVKEGLIARLADLHEVPNLILILDGFDELVMASRQRLRHFFNVLLEDLRTGPLRHAKAIVSGRDTLFPGGDGLPRGSHVLSLLPFDSPRVSAWGEKWRTYHSSGPGASFRPETFLDSPNKQTSRSPLHHLVSWPLTLHLVARVHTAGHLDVGAKGGREVEKAYLYRSILADTSSRQTQQAHGEGRLDPVQMRAFLRSLAWEMHTRSKDSLDPSDVVPLLNRLYPKANESALAELADTAVVNSPELQKGEDTGFEFVHKSFSEYLVAEKIAWSVQEITHKISGIDGGVEWRCSQHEAATKLAEVMAIRLMPIEVQEMLEPMIGSFVAFAKGQRVDEIVQSSERISGLLATVERCEHLYGDFLNGSILPLVLKEAALRDGLREPLEVYANYGAGILLIGAAAARHVSEANGPDQPSTVLKIEPFEGAFWRYVTSLVAGGLRLDNDLAHRLFRGTTVRSQGSTKTVSDWSLPIKLSHLAEVEGYESSLTEEFSQAQRQLINSIIDQIIKLVSLNLKRDPGDHIVTSSYFRHKEIRRSYNEEQYASRDRAGYNLYNLSSIPLFHIILGLTERLAHSGFVRDSVSDGFYEFLDVTMTHLTEWAKNNLRPTEEILFAQLLSEVGEEMRYNARSQKEDVLGRWFIEIALIFQGKVEGQPVHRSTKRHKPE